MWTFAKYMTEDQAQEIVCAYLDVIEEGNPIVSDEERLPCPKEKIREAFYIHINGYENMRALSETTFKEMGYDKHVAGLQSMLAGLDSFMTILPEDKQAVANLLTEPMPSMVSMKIMAKYLKP